MQTLVFKTKGHSFWFGWGAGAAEPPEQRRGRQGAGRGGRGR